MADNDPTIDPPANENPTNTDPAPGGGDEKNADYWQKAAEKWKALSRKHEDAEKALKNEVTNLKTASMSDAEKAIADARKEGEASTLKKVTERLVKAELKTIAAEKGATLPDLDALNLAKFATDEGDPDEEAIGKFVESLGVNKKRFADGKDLGIGRSGGESKPKQWTREDLQGKSHAEIVKAREGGHLDTLLGKE